MPLTYRQRFTMKSKICTITIIKYGDNANERKQVIGRPVVIEGLEQFKLFLHRPIVGNVNKGWKVSEESTGLSVTGSTYRTQKEAIEEAAEHIADRGGSEALAKNIATFLFNL
jgi:hypothetical protein